MTPPLSLLAPPAPTPLGAVGLSVPDPSPSSAGFAGVLDGYPLRIAEGVPVPPGELPKSAAVCWECDLRSSGSSVLHPIPEKMLGRCLGWERALLLLWAVPQCSGGSAGTTCMSLEQFPSELGEPALPGRRGTELPARESRNTQRVFPCLPPCAGCSLPSQQAQHFANRV